MVNPATFVKWRLSVNAVLTIGSTIGLAVLTVVSVVNHEWSPAFGTGLLVVVFGVPTSVLFVRLLLQRPWRNLGSEAGQAPPGSREPAPDSTSGPRA